MRVWAEDRVHTQPDVAAIRRLFTNEINRMGYTPLDGLVGTTYGAYGRKFFPVFSSFLFFSIHVRHDNSRGKENGTTTRPTSPEMRENIKTGHDAVFFFFYRSIRVLGRPSGITHD